MKKLILALLSTLCMNNLNANPSSQDLLNDLVQSYNQELLTIDIFEQKIKTFVNEGGNLNEPIKKGLNPQETLVDKWKRMEAKYITFLDFNKQQSLLSHIFMFSDNAENFSKILIKYGANPLEDIYLRFCYDEDMYLRFCYGGGANPLKVYLRFCGDKATSYKGTSFDGMIVTVMLDIDWVLTYYFLAIFANLLENYDEKTCEQIIHATFERSYNLLDVVLFQVLSKNELKNAIEHFTEKISGFKDLIQEIKSGKCEHETINIQLYSVILTAMLQELESAEQKLKLKL